MFALSACGGSSDPGVLKYSSEMDFSSRKLLNESIRSLDEYPIHEPTKKLLKIMKLKDASPESLRSWLSERVQYVVSSSFDWTSHISIAEMNYNYEFPSILPEVIEGFESKEEEDIDLIPEDLDNITLMSNDGSALYIVGKIEKTLFSATIPGHGEVLVTSPRVGILKNGNFTPQFDSNRVEKLFTISTLFHEARHSDGNGKSLSFFHYICPEDHDYEGYPACDKSANGPYGIGAEFLKNITKACSRCSEVEKELLRLLYIDAKSRVLVDDSAIWDDRPEGLKPKSAN